MNVRQVKQCRVCSNEVLEPVLDLGVQALTGVFPKQKDEEITEGPLRLLFCPKCSLLQLEHSYDLNEMYGENYGYRSGLNASMVKHLTTKVHWLESRFNLKSSDVVLDIGSNDGTTLNAYSISGLRRIGMDPTGRKFHRYYDEGVELIPDFFSKAGFLRVSEKPASLVTSIAMFYDLESPISFAREIESILSENGVWHFEQSYLPTMLRNNAYDTICHEHLEYYSLTVVKHIVESAGMRILDVSINDINGGSFAVTAVKERSCFESNDVLINWMLEHEHDMGLDTACPYLEFAERVSNHRNLFLKLLNELCSAGKVIYGYGASTKGNVILQYCGITPSQITAIAEVNPDKFGAWTPKTLIPIIPESEARLIKPDYMIVFPWHFRNGFLAKEQDFTREGGRFIFPLPYVEII